jgi:membrane protein YqaA with SNARE-associated domain
MAQITLTLPAPMALATLTLLNNPMVHRLTFAMGFYLAPDWAFMTMVTRQPDSVGYWAIAAVLCSFVSGVSCYATGRWGRDMVRWSLTTGHKFGITAQNNPWLLDARLLRLIPKSWANPSMAHHPVQQWIDQYGVLGYAIAAVTPLPFRLSNTLAGAAKLPFWPFCLAMLLTTSLRFWVLGLLVSGVLASVTFTVTSLAIALALCLAALGLRQAYPRIQARLSGAAG